MTTLSLQPFFRGVWMDVYDEKDGGHVLKDASLLQQIASGDEGAVRESIDMYGGLVWSLARRFLSNAAEAEDAVQEIFVELWKSAGRFDPAIAAETTFVSMIARRRLIDRSRRRRSAPDLRPLDDTYMGGTDPADDEGTSDRATRALSALGQLSADQQKVLRLSIMQGLSHDKISQATGMPLGTVKTHARRGLIRLREILSADAVVGEVAS